MTEAALDVRQSSMSYTVDDIERSLRFYEALGFAIKERMEDEGKLVGVMLNAGTCDLGLSQDDFAKGRGRVKGIGVRLWLRTDQDLDALATRIRAAGVEVDGPRETPWGSRAIMASDPDGFKLTIHDR